VVGWGCFSVHVTVVGWVYVRRVVMVAGESGWVGSAGCLGWRAWGSGTTDCVLWVVCGCGGLGWRGVQPQVQAGDAQCDAVAAALNTFEGVTGMYCGSDEWLYFSSSSSSKCEPAKNQLNTFSDVDLDCGCWVSPHALRNAASST
jgi:hypothetical protein